MNTSKAVIAIFTKLPPTFTLTVTVAGNGSGTTTSSPSGIDCGIDCTEIYSSGTIVALTPTPAVGSVFTGWSGDADCGDGSVTLNASKTCTATFTLDGVLQNPLCPSATTLEGLVQCIKGYIPLANSEGFVPPSPTVQTDWRLMVGQMLAQGCPVTLPLSLQPLYAVGTFTDAENGQIYCVLLEIVDQDNNHSVDAGWGTFIVNHQASRELAIQIPHPLHDTNTPEQGIGIFKGVGARSFLLSGTHRYTNSVASSCQPSYEEADAAHNVDNLFQAAVVELMAFYDSTLVSFVALQFHGMGVTNCSGVDVYLTHGRTTTPQAGDAILQLQANLQQEPLTSSWVVVVPGDALSCSLNGTDNVQGRLLNGVASGDLCTVAATGYTGRFIHIEQKFDFRNAADWISAILATF